MHVKLNNRCSNSNSGIVTGCARGLSVQGSNYYIQGHFFFRTSFTCTTEIRFTQIHSSMQIPWCIPKCGGTFNDSPVTLKINPPIE